MMLYKHETPIVCRNVANVVTLVFITDQHVCGPEQMLEGVVQGVGHVKERTINSLAGTEISSLAEQIN